MTTDSLNNIASIKEISFGNILAKKPIEPQGKTFDKFYEAALSVINEVNTYQRQAEQAQLDIATGKSDDILAVMMAQEKAYASLNFTVQVTNKIVEAYREIMRLQV